MFPQKCVVSDPWLKIKVGIDLRDCSLTRFKTRGPKDAENSGFFFLYV